MDEDQKAIEAWDKVPVVAKLQMLREHFTDSDQGLVGDFNYSANLTCKAAISVIEQLTKEQDKLLGLMATDEKDHSYCDCCVQNPRDPEYWYVDSCQCGNADDKSYAQEWCGKANLYEKAKKIVKGDKP